MERDGEPQAERAPKPRKEVVGVALRSPLERQLVGLAAAQRGAATASAYGRLCLLRDVRDVVNELVQEAEAELSRAPSEA